VNASSTDHSEPWPELPLEAWAETCAALHLHTQIAGKVRLAQTPWINHAWHATLQVTARGLSTTAIPHGDRTFEIELDFVEHKLTVRVSDGQEGGFPLDSGSVAGFYSRLMQTLAQLSVPVTISRKPNEIDNATRFDLDHKLRPYDREQVNRYWRVLVHSARVFTRFRSRFTGKCSPVHYFWGAPDLAVTRFSGRTAPQHAGGVPNLPDWVARDAYSHEVSSCGFWPGGGPVPYPAYYAYAYPEPAGFAEAKLSPSSAHYNTDLREFILPYDTVRSSASPDDTLLAFLQSSYEAAADRAEWDRASLEDLRYVPATLRR
jgi:hypothetical protein